MSYPHPIQFDLDNPINFEVDDSYRTREIKNLSEINAQLIAGILDLNNRVEDLEQEVNQLTVLKRALWRRHHWMIKAIRNHKEFVNKLCKNFGIPVSPNDKILWKILENETIANFKEE